jgi:hypothetical protein
LGAVGVIKKILSVVLFVLFAISLWATIPQDDPRNQSGLFSGSFARREMMRHRRAFFETASKNNADVLSSASRLSILSTPSTLTCNEIQLFGVGPIDSQTVSVTTPVFVITGITDNFGVNTASLKFQISDDPNPHNWNDDYFGWWPSATVDSGISFNAGTATISGFTLSDNIYYIRFTGLDNSGNTMLRQATFINNIKTGVYDTGLRAVYSESVWNMIGHELAQDSKGNWYLLSLVSGSFQQANPRSNCPIS